MVAAAAAVDVAVDDDGARLYIEMARAPLRRRPNVATMVAQKINLFLLIVFFFLI